MSIIMAFYFWVGKKLPVLYIDCWKRQWNKGICCQEEREKEAIPTCDMSFPEIIKNTQGRTIVLLVDMNSSVNSPNKAKKVDQVLPEKAKFTDSLLVCASETILEAPFNSE